MSHYYFNFDDDPDWDAIDDDDYAQGYRQIQNRNSYKKCECGLDAAIAAGASGGKHADYCPKYDPKT